ncbi:hypothetical protein GQY15_00645 [Rhodobacter sphaeroides]|uniref:hypothetical protein n=1 Tax=Cereibacter sphaeroides TaxID=1063 RepID=UPI0013216446|nr:hypothetical protein [Cereibacter sphaeroides]MWP36107.1 hypothetical protein [Cereibacter sphaeroides]
MSIPFSFPADYLGSVASGEVIRYGAILKDAASGRIVAHMQETGLLQNMLSAPTAGLPLNPFSPISALSSLGANWQLYRLDGKIEQTMQIMQGFATLQMANIALAGLGLGVSVVGFAMIKSRLNEVSLKIDTLTDLVRRGFEEQRLRELRDLEARLDAQLDHAEEAWSHADGGTRVWTRVADNLNDMVYSYPRLIEQNLRAEAPQPEMLAYLLERYRVLAATRIECLILTGEMTSARDFATRFSRRTNSLLNDITPVDFARARIAANTREPHLELRRQLPEARRFVANLREFQDVFETKPLLIDALIERRQDGRDYIQSLREQKEPLVLLAL